MFGRFQKIKELWPIIAISKSELISRATIIN